MEDEPYEWETQDARVGRGARSGWVVRAFLGALCVLVIFVGPVLSTPKTTEIPPLTPNAARPLRLLPLGSLREADLSPLAASLQRRTGLAVEVASPEVPPASIFDLSQGRDRADKLLDWLFEAHPPDGRVATLAVTSDAMGGDDGAALDGLANLRDRVGVLSARRFRDELRSADPQTRGWAQDQLSRAAFHELAHLLGMPHCPQEGCLLSALSHKGEITPQTRPCERCASELQRRLAAPHDPLQEAMLRGDGHLDRGHPARALRRYREVSRALPDDAPPLLQAELHNRLGVALLELERPAAASPHFERALALAPALPAPRYNRALLYALLGEEGEALRELEAWELLEPDAQTRHGLSARFYLDALGDPGSALLELRRYRASGGEDARLLEALDGLENPDFLVFEPYEVVPIAP